MSIHLAKHAGLSQNCTRAPSCFGFVPKLFSRSSDQYGLGALSDMGKWSFFFLISSAVLAVTYVTCGLPVMLFILCVLTYTGLVLLDLPDATDNGKPRHVSTIGTVKDYGGRRQTPKKDCEKTDKAKDKIDMKRAQQIDPVRLQLEHEAHSLLSFYIWYLLAGAKELTFDEIAEKVNQKFRSLLDEKDISKVFVDNMGFRGGPFFTCSPEGWKSRLAYYLHRTLRIRLVSLEYSFSKPNNALELVNNLERHQQRIRDIELKALLNPGLTFRANRDSPWWRVYQRKMDGALQLARLNNLFPDKETRRIYE